MKLLLFAATPLLCHAIPFFLANAGSGPGTVGISCVSSGLVQGNSPVGASMTCGSAGGSTDTTTAVANFGHLGAFGNAITVDGSGLDTSASAQMTGVVNFAATPADFPTGFIPVSLNLEINGNLNSTSSASAEIRFNTSLANQIFGIYDEQHANGIVQVCTSAFVGVPGCGNVAFGPVVTGTVLIPINTDVNLNLALQLLVSSGGPSHSAMGDFSHSFDFPVNSPVFNVPDGVAVNSSDLEIFNNQFAGNGTSTPEPSSLAFIGLGLGLVMFVRLRRRTV